MRHRRWFRSKARSIVSVSAKDAITLGKGQEAVLIVFVRVDFREGDPETYLLPLAHATGDELKELELQSSQAIVARLESPGSRKEVIMFFVPSQVELVFERSAGSDRYGITLSWGV